MLREALEYLVGLGKAQAPQVYGQRRAGERFVRTTGPDGPRVEITREPPDERVECGALEALAAWVEAHGTESARPVVYVGDAGLMARDGVHVATLPLHPSAAVEWLRGLDYETRIPARMLRAALRYVVGPEGLRSAEGLDDAVARLELSGNSTTQMEATRTKESFGSVVTRGVREAGLPPPRQVLLVSPWRDDWAYMRHPLEVLLDPDPSGGANWVLHVTEAAWASFWALAYDGLLDRAAGLGLSARRGCDQTLARAADLPWKVH